MKYKINIKGNSLYAIFYEGDSFDVFNDIALLSTFAVRNNCTTLNYNGEIFNVYPPKNKQTIRYETTDNMIYEIKNKNRTNDFIEDGKFKYYYKDGEKVYYDKTKILSILKAEKYACLDKDSYDSYFDKYPLYILDKYIVILNTDIKDNEIVYMKDRELQKKGDIVLCL